MNETHGRPIPTRVLTEFAWRCPNGHLFATAMFDIPLTSWERATEARPWRPAADV